MRERFGKEGSPMRAFQVGTLHGDTLGQEPQGPGPVLDAAGFGSDHSHPSHYAAGVPA